MAEVKYKKITVKAELYDELVQIAIRLSAAEEEQITVPDVIRRWVDREAVK